MLNTVIRDLEPGDAAAVERLIMEAIEATYRGVYPERAIDYFKRLHERSAITERLQAGVVLVAERDGVVVGTGSLVGDEIGGVFVRADSQGEGIGTLLMDELEDRAAAQRLQSVSLCVSLPARGFYERRGYVLSDLLSGDMGEGQSLDYWVGEKCVREKGCDSVSGSPVLERPVREASPVTEQQRHEESAVSPEEEVGKAGGFSAEEREAMKERVKELKAESRRGSRAKADGEGEVLAKIGELPEPDRRMALRIHEIVKATAPALSPRTWYGMPAYALEGKVVCFFQGAQKFKSRYATLGFNDAANLDEGEMWPTAFALVELTPAVEERIAALIKKAVS